jgi:hypothetical protein
MFAPMTDATSASPLPTEPATDRLRFDEPMTIAARILLAGFGAMTFLAPWDLLIRPGHAFEFGKLPFWFLSAGALAVGLPCLFAAILGISRSVAIDFERRLLIERGRGGFGISFDRSRRFADLIGLEVVENAWSDGPSTWEVEAHFGIGRPWRLARHRDRATAEAMRATLAARIAARAVPQSPEI